MKKIYRKSELTNSADRGKKTKVITDRNRSNMDLLLMAKRCWDGLYAMRKNRMRCRRYTFGNQWGDYIFDPDSKSWITEENYIKKQGKVPLKNNVIRQLVKSVLGQFRSNHTEPVCACRDRDEQKIGEMMSTAIQYVYQLNRLWELDARLLEEFLISGICVSKTCFGWKTGKDKQDVWVDIVNPNRVFFDNGMEDVRHWDCSLIGEIHDMTLEDLLSVFASTPEEKRKLLEIYNYQSSDFLYQTITNLSSERVDNLDFLNPSESGLCRVIELWTRESKERIKCHDVLKGEYYKIEKSELFYVKEENDRRLQEAILYGVEVDDVALIEYEWFIDRFWYFRFLSPLGDILKEGESPYYHKEHPYSFKLYPFLDGEVHSFVNDVIDQQRYINRMITMIDFIMGSSAKGVLMFPEEALPEGMTLEEIAEEWVRYNGVILCKTRGGVQMPQQISTNATNVGAYEMLNLQLRLLDDISGVHGAMQGKDPNKGTASSLYAQQAQNSSLNLIDLFESFKIFREDRDYKVMKLIQQYYREPRYLNIVGSGYGKESGIYDPDKVKNMEFDIAISESTSTPVYRDLANNFLMELFKAGQITIEMLLENGNFPYADRLLQSINWIILVIVLFSPFLNTGNITVVPLTECLITSVFALVFIPPLIMDEVLSKTKFFEWDYLERRKKLNFTISYYWLISIFCLLLSFSINIAHVNLSDNSVMAAVERSESKVFFYTWYIFPILFFLFNMCNLISLYYPLFEKNLTIDHCIEKKPINWRDSEPDMYEYFDNKTKSGDPRP